MKLYLLETTGTLSFLKKKHNTKQYIVLYLKAGANHDYYWMAR